MRGSGREPRPAPRARQEWPQARVHTITCLSTRLGAPGSAGLGLEPPGRQRAGRRGNSAQNAASGKEKGRSGWGVGEQQRAAAQDGCNPILRKGDRRRGKGRALLAWVAERGGGTAPH